MNKAQKEVLKSSLTDEKRTIRELKQVYAMAKADCEERIRELSSRTDMENLQTIIYQKKYQEALKKQLDDVLDKLDSNQYDTISEYLNDCYENGYIGTMYDLQHQGIPMAVPINQNQVVKAIQTDTKLSSRKYKGNPLKGRLEEDVNKLKTSIRAELSRGIANGSSWNDIAVKIATGMNNPIDKAFRNALLITRTEGHRVQQSAIMDACHVAKDKGADIVKQWDATMDGLTRPEHREADGQIRELDEYFDVGGEKMKAPAIGGSASNVCNCRCQLLQRARWALDEDELKTLQKKAQFFGLDKSESFKDFKKKYLKLPENADTIDLKPDALHPENLAGVKRGAEMSHADADSGKVNPKYRENVGHNGYHINCQSCVVNYEARRRGYDVETLPNYNNPIAKAISYNTNLAWIDPDTGMTPPIKRSGVKTAKQLVKYVNENVKEGERYTFQFYWRNYNSGHIVTMYKENGQVIMYDPQPNTVTKGDDRLESYFKNIQFRQYGHDVSPNLLRVDNLLFDEDRAKGIMKKAGD